MDSQPLTHRDAGAAARSRAGATTSWLRRLEGATGPVAAPTGLGRHGSLWILLDCSSSMASSMPDAVAGIQELAQNAIRDRWRVGLLHFTTSAQIAVEPSANLAAILHALGHCRADGGTAFEPPMLLVESAISGDSGSTRLLLATDGHSDLADQDSALRIADRLRKRGVTITTLGISGADQEFLRKLACNPSRHVESPRGALRGGFQRAARALLGPS